LKSLKYHPFLFALSLPHLIPVKAENAGAEMFF
jgi:hypothetical protein